VSSYFEIELLKLALASSIADATHCSGWEADE